MPYKSDAQRRYFNVPANRVKLESQGVDVDEWNKSSKGKKLPKKLSKKAAAAVRQLIIKRAAVPLHQIAAPAQAAAPAAGLPGAKVPPKPLPIAPQSSGTMLPEQLRTLFKQGAVVQLLVKKAATTANKPKENLRDTTKKLESTSKPPARMQQKTTPPPKRQGLQAANMQAPEMEVPKTRSTTQIPDLRTASNNWNMSAAEPPPPGHPETSVKAPPLEPAVSSQQAPKPPVAAKPTAPKPPAAKPTAPRPPVAAKPTAPKPPAAPPKAPAAPPQAPPAAPSRMAQLGMDSLKGVGPGLLVGGAVGGLQGLLQDPGEDEQGKKKSRMENILRNMLMGGAVGGAAGGALPGALSATRMLKGASFAPSPLPIAKQPSPVAQTAAAAAAPAADPTLVQKLLAQMPTGQGMVQGGKQLLNRASQAVGHSQLLPGMMIGGAAGGLQGLLEDPGEDERGRRKSRLLNALSHAGIGSAVGGGVGGLMPKAGSDVSQLARISCRLNKQATTEYDEEAHARSEDKKEKKHQQRENLGPREHAYVADAMGGRAIANTGAKLQQMHKDPDNPYQGKYDRFLTMQGGISKNIGERIDRGASRMAESPLWRLLAMLDPTANGSREGYIGLASGFGGGENRAAGAKRRAGEAYTKFLKKHQDKLDANAQPSERQTPWHLGMQSQLANLDSDVAGHNYMRKERPGHYWLNPLSKSGPLQEVGDRLMRRTFAGLARPESTAGRFGAGLGSVATLGTLPLLMGGEKAQQKLRAAAAGNQLYAPEAMPELKAPRQEEPEEEYAKAASLVGLLACRAARQKQAGWGETWEAMKAKAQEKYNQLPSFSEVRQGFQELPRTVRQVPPAINGMVLGSRAGAGALAGGAAGGLLGLMEDPGDDEHGRKKNQFNNALLHALGGSAIGGLAGAAFPQGGNLGGELGGRLGAAYGGWQYDHGR